MPESSSRATIKWRTLAIVLGVLLALSVSTLVMTFAIATSYEKLPKDVADRVAAYVESHPPATAGPSPSPSGTDLSPAPDLADQVAVAWSVATGWPSSEKWGYVMSFKSVDDDLLVQTNLDAAADLSELCTMLFQLNDPVLALDPQIDQVLVLGTDGQVVWSCVTTAEVQ